MLWSGTRLHRLLGSPATPALHLADESIGCADVLLDGGGDEVLERGNCPALGEAIGELERGYIVHRDVRDELVVFVGDDDGRWWGFGIIELARGRLVVCHYWLLSRLLLDRGMREPAPLVRALEDEQDSCMQHSIWSGMGRIDDE